MLRGGGRWVWGGAGGAEQAPWTRGGRVGDKQVAEAGAGARPTRCACFPCVTDTTGPN